MKSLVLLAVALQILFALPIKKQEDPPATVPAATGSELNPLVEVWSDDEEDPAFFYDEEYDEGDDGDDPNDVIVYGEDVIVGWDDGLE